MLHQQYLRMENKQAAEERQYSQDFSRCRLSTEVGRPPGRAPGQAARRAASPGACKRLLSPPLACLSRARPPPACCQRPGTRLPPLPPPLRGPELFPRAPAKARQPGTGHAGFCRNRRRLGARCQALDEELMALQPPLCSKALSSPDGRLAEPPPPRLVEEPQPPTRPLAFASARCHG